MSGLKVLAGIVGAVLCLAGIAAGLGSDYMGQLDKLISIIIGTVLFAIGATLFDWAVGYSRRKKKRREENEREQAAFEAADRKRRTCPGCGQTSSPMQRVCPWCGHEMGVAVEPSEGRPRKESNGPTVR